MHDDLQRENIYQHIIAGIIHLGDSIMRYVWICALAVIFVGCGEDSSKGTASSTDTRSDASRDMLAGDSGSDVAVGSDTSTDVAVDIPRTGDTSDGGEDVTNTEDSTDTADVVECTAHSVPKPRQPHKADDQQGMLMMAAGQRRY